MPIWARAFKYVYLFAFLRAAEQALYCLLVLFVNKRVRKIGNVTLQ